MCGRYTLKTNKKEIEVIADPSDLDEEILSPRYNIAPSQSVPIIKENKLSQASWGLIPHWAKDLTKISPQI